MTTPSQSPRIPFDVVEHIIQAVSHIQDEYKIPTLTSLGMGKIVPLEPIIAPVTNSRVILKEYVEPGVYIEPGKHLICDNSETIDLDTVPLHGGILVNVLELSIDLYLCVQTRQQPPSSTLPGYKVGKPIDGTGVAVILRSENPAFRKGDHVSGALPHQSYAIITTLSVVPIKNKYNLPWSAFVGPIGLSGITAYVGWKEYSHAKKGKTVFVSSGAGPVGSVVIQLAKNDGLKVIALAGSDEKVEFMKECSADVVVNYKTRSIKEMLEKEGPIDIYWDDVGGETLDLALQFAKSGG